MADPNYSWFYLVLFLAIPLSRIIPRLISKRREKTDGYKTKETQTEQSTEWRPKQESLKSQTKEMQVLGIMHQGANTFDKIQKNTQIETKVLDSILQELEQKGLIKVVEKQGMFGPKIELYSTDKGFKEYYS
ncbi:MULTISPECIES: winged helix-turn-helix transcriptional regulator [Nitrosopumilus]|uniref:HTH hxlR-type domain-containing protein n=1 Tax=Nitrosopumilus piranensis TaxID=1582439 RepID=A0A0C5C010_9ARCH|nr:MULTISPECIES: winged helix-turn-helix transcriptional regulator [Nitrosopumilus]AJM92590.1 hypothetical protein NPIRD3C_1378 [Nitrosopumilus piranensis]KAF6244470.1 hypothetical protein C6989_09380 [Nitrosopumilus sp. b2]